LGQIMYAQYLKIFLFEPVETIPGMGEAERWRG
jgi:hypothetical protein